MNDRDEFISGNIGLVHSCARKFIDRGIEYDDLFQAGCVGLIKAVDGFDISLGFAFSTYAVPAILGEIRRLFRDGGAVKVGRALKEKAKLVQREKEIFTKEFGVEPTVGELSSRLGITDAEVCELLIIGTPPLSLTANFENDEKELDIPVEGEQEKLEMHITLSEGISGLSGEDKQLIELRYFRNLTQVKTAEILGMSQVQVSRREKKILASLREMMAV